MHWVHIGALGVLTYTGLQIHSLSAVSESHSAGNIHMGVMPLFLGTAIIRFIWAFTGSGSAERGAFHRMSDWRHFVFHRGDGRAAMDWLACYAGIHKEAPPVLKYNPLQRAVYAFVFPILVVVLAITGFSLSDSYVDSMAGITGFLGGEEQVRALHTTAMWALLLLTALHSYAAFRDGLGRLSLMLTGWTPRSMRAQPDDEL